MIDGAFRASKTFELVVLRHGRTAWNENGRFQGHADIPLDETGRGQALALHAYLFQRAFTRAISSDLGRAHETARIVLGERGPLLETDARWREMRFGTWEGLTWPEIVARHPELAERNAKTPKFFTPDGGESFDDVRARVSDAVGALDAAASDGDLVLVATHAGPLHALLRVALGSTEAEALGVRFEPATITRISFSPAGARVLELNRSATAVA
jgi:broad specificity phosphatase PhoE